MVTDIPSYTETRQKHAYNMLKIYKSSVKRNNKPFVVP